MAHAAFYAVSRGVLKVLAHLAEHGEYEELHGTIRLHAEQLKALQGLRPRARRN